MENLNLYVWEDVLSDWSDGIMFALAENVEQARRMLEEQIGYYHSDLEQEPRVISTPEAFHVRGGQ